METYKKSDKRKISSRGFVYLQSALWNLKN